MFTTPWLFFIWTVSVTADDVILMWVTSPRSRIMNYNNFHCSYTVNLLLYPICSLWRFPGIHTQEGYNSLLTFIETPSYKTFSCYFNNKNNVTEFIIIDGHILLTQHQLWSQSDFNSLFHSQPELYLFKT